MFKPSIDQKNFQSKLDVPFDNTEILEFKESK